MVEPVGHLALPEEGDPHGEWLVVFVAKPVIETEAAIPHMGYCLHREHNDGEIQEVLAQSLHLLHRAKGNGIPAQ